MAGRHGGHGLPCLHSALLARCWSCCCCPALVCMLLKLPFWTRFLTSVKEHGGWQGERFQGTKGQDPVADREGWHLMMNQLSSVWTQGSCQSMEQFVHGGCAQPGRQQAGGLAEQWGIEQQRLLACVRSSSPPHERRPGGCSPGAGSSTVRTRRAVTLLRQLRPARHGSSWAEATVVKVCARPGRGGPPAAACSSENGAVDHMSATRRCAGRECRLPRVPDQCRLCPQKAS